MTQQQSCLEMISRADLITNLSTKNAQGGLHQNASQNHLGFWAQEGPCRLQHCLSGHPASLPPLKFRLQTYGLTPETTDQDSSRQLLHL